MGDATFTMPRATQRKLVLDDKPAVVLSTVETARQILPGHDEDDIVSLIEEGFIAFAWNIALTSDAARSLRIFPDCLTWYSRTFGKGMYPGADADILDQLLKSTNGKPFIKGSTLRLVLNCSSAHLINLIDSGALRLQAGTSYKRGPTGTPLVTITSVTQFFKSRRML